MLLDAMCHFTAIHSFKLRLSSRSSYRIQIIDFSTGLTLKFDGWPRKTIGHLFYATSSFVHHFVAVCKFELKLRVRKRSIRIKIGDFLSRVTLKFDRLPYKTIGYLFYATSSFEHHFTAICEFKLKLRAGNAQIGAKYILTSVNLTFDPWPWPFAWPSLLSMVTTPENFMVLMIR